MVLIEYYLITQMIQTNCQHLSHNMYHIIELILQNIISHISTLIILNRLIVNIM